MTPPLLAVGVRIGLFDLLAAETLDVDEIAAKLDKPLRPTQLLLAALQGMDLVRRTETGFELAEDAATFLVRGREGWLGGLIDLEVESFLSPRLIFDAMDGDDASVYGGIDPWERHQTDPEQARRFTEAMHSISERPARGLAETVDLHDVESLLDVGGGSGTYTIALARAWPRLHCTVLELPTICPLTERYVSAAHLEARIGTKALDMFANPWPVGVGAVLFSQIFHDWPPERCAQLARNAFNALEAGGRILIHEKLVRDDGSGPLANTLVNLDMLVWTRGQQWTARGLRHLLADTGFTEIQTEPTVGYWSVVSARKPAAGKSVTC